MARRVKEYIDITDFQSMDELIRKLVELRDNLPSDAEAELRLRGDDVFGRKLSITYFRDQTAAEAECEARYSRREPSSQDSATADRARTDGKLRIVA